MRLVELESGPVEYLDEGDGPPVVLLHGLVMNHTQWGAVMPFLPDGFRYIRPVLPLGGHRLPMRHGADLSLDGLVRLIAELLEALDLAGTTLVHSDWGGGLFLTAHELDTRIGRSVIFPCEVLENFPPGLPGHMARVAARIPGGLSLAARQLRIPAMRRSSLLLGQMAKHPLPDPLIESWTHGLINSAGVRRDLRTYLTSPISPSRLRLDTDALRYFDGSTLIAWGAESRVMPPSDGRHLAALLPCAVFVEIPDSRALPMLDNPQDTARVLSDFLEARVPITDTYFHSISTELP